MARAFVCQGNALPAATRAASLFAVEHPGLRGHRTTMVRISLNVSPQNGGGLLWTLMQAQS